MDESEARVVDRSQGMKTTKKTVDGRYVTFGLLYNKRQRVDSRACPRQNHDSNTRRVMMSSCRRQ
jgi:hypothetical protein